ncbi:MAG: carbamoyltransferase HypF, partial [Planctomycetota bacterium]
MIDRHAKPAPTPRRRAAEHWTVVGAVQGVGFRPFVHRLANELGLIGSVRNDGRVVAMHLAGDPLALEWMALRLHARGPRAAVIERIERCPADWPRETAFRIDASAPAAGAPSSLISIPPDLATCPECAVELFDPNDRRYRYPFLNCTHCGPRYTVMRALPYDRARTTLSDFVLCEACGAEYGDPSDRRFHAQPTACPECGPQLAWVEGSEQRTREAALAACVGRLRAGAIVAVQGLGGFHLMVRADSADAVNELRRRKARGDKPFAVMFADLADLERRLAAPLDPRERDTLASPAAPVVLLRQARPAGVAAEVAPIGLDMGCLLAATPLHLLLLRDVGVPLVATSGNLRDEPIMSDPQEARSSLASIADAFLFHDRPIARPVDDSVVRVVSGELQILRRARGFAPLSFVGQELPPTGVDLALGAHQKATVALRVGRRITLSPHLGDLETTGARAHHVRSAEDLAHLAEVAPARIVCDAHPDYASTQLAERLDERPVRVQHHEAHVRAAAFEYGLSGGYDAAAWDGTGYGLDGTIWGGEFFTADASGELDRVARFAPFPLLGGERAAREPWRCALGLLHAAYGDRVPERLARAPRQAARTRSAVALEHVLAGARVAPLTSSVGRMFDALAGLLGLCDRSAFEADAALRV